MKKSNRKIIYIDVGDMTEKELDEVMEKYTGQKPFKFKWWEFLGFGIWG